MTVYSLKSGHYKTLPARFGVPVLRIADTTHQWFPYSDSLLYRVVRHYRGYWYSTKCAIPYGIEFNKI